MKSFKSNSNVLKSRYAGSFNLEMAFGLSAPLCRRLADPRRNQSFSFEAFERRVDRPNRRETIGYALDFGANRRSVCAFAQAKHGQQYDMLEFAEVGAFRHNIYILDNIVSGVNSPGSEQHSGRTASKRKPSIVWRLTIRLTGVMPIVWRTILVRPDTKLAMLHRYLQAAMGWRDCHLFVFTINGKEYAIPNRDRDVNRKIYDARRYTLARLFPTLRAQFDYVYDFGDWWEHVLEIEDEEEALYRKQYPICVAGAEPCPPEDSGGPRGYRELLTALRDPTHPEHENWSAWAKARFYPRNFDPQDATWMMRDMQRGYV